MKKGRTHTDCPYFRFKVLELRRQHGAAAQVLAAIPKLQVLLLTRKLHHFANLGVVANSGDFHLCPNPTSTSRSNLSEGSGFSCIMWLMSGHCGSTAPTSVGLGHDTQNPTLYTKSPAPNSTLQTLNPRTVNPKSPNRKSFRAPKPSTPN